MKDFYSLGQGKHRGNQEYLDAFNTMVTTAEESGATNGTHAGGISESVSHTAVGPATHTDAEQNAALKTATKRYQAVTFLPGPTTCST